jgi:hypothetical protein
MRLAPSACLGCSTLYLQYVTWPILFTPNDARIEDRNTRQVAILDPRSSIPHNQAVISLSE